MSFANNNKPKTPSLWHSEIVKQPRLVTIKAVKVVKNGEKCLAELIFNGVEHVYWINKPEIKSLLEQYIGQTVVLLAGGNDKQGTETLEVQAAGGSGANIPQPPPKFAASAPQQRAFVQQPEAQPEQPVQPAAQPTHGPADREIKQFLCQSTNLMRLCLKKAHDLKNEFGLNDEQRQTIASCLFIETNRKVGVTGLPLNPYTLEQLGVVKPVQNEPEGDDIPY